MGQALPQTWLCRAYLKYACMCCWCQLYTDAEGLALTSKASIHPWVAAVDISAAEPVTP